MKRIFIGLLEIELPPGPFLKSYMKGLTNKLPLHNILFACEWSGWLGFHFFYTTFTIVFGDKIENKWRLILDVLSVVRD